MIECIKRCEGCMGVRPAASADSSTAGCLQKLAGMESHSKIGGAIEF
jgi:hypothetical protein